MSAVLPPRSKKTIAKLKLMFKEQHTLMMLLKEFRDGIMICDDEGLVLQVNDSLKTLLHLDDGIVGQHATAVVKNEQFKDVLKTVMASGKTLVEDLRVQTPCSAGVAGSTTTHFFELHAVPIFIPAGQQSPYARPDAHREEVTGCVFIFHDITDIRRTEKMRRDFVANVSHELRTPLSAIEGYSETLLNGALEDETVRREFVNVIYNHSLRLSRLVSDLLDLSKLESPDYKPELRPVSVVELIAHVADMIAAKAEEKAIILTTEAVGTIPPVLAEASSLEQVLTNLMDNAVKYTPMGGRVSVRVFVNERNRVQVDVRDTGIGIDPKYQPRVFERFYRVDKARSRDMGGTGLGLAIVKHIIQLHGGEIWVESVPNQGSTFSFTLESA